MEYEDRSLVILLLLVDRSVQRHGQCAVMKLGGM